MMRVQCLATLMAVSFGCLVAVAETPETTFPIADKTLVAWVAMANLTQRGGSVLTLENPGSVFDGIVLGEIATGKWMAGSEGFARTQSDQAASDAEAVGPDKFVQIAVVYRGKQVSIYRDGRPYASYAFDGAPVAFTKDCVVLFGLRHRMAGTPRIFAGMIDDARIYNTALDEATIAALKPNQPSEPKPIAWWSFEDGRADDLMKTFPAGQLVGKARVADGKLYLPGEESYMMAGVELPPTRATEDWPMWHFTALPQESHCLPYDPNGAIFWKGKYHLGYIYQESGKHCWGHASSSDLVNWTFHPASLKPEPGDADKGTFSGNAFVSKEGKPMLCWFGLEAGVCVATAEDDDLIRWKKHPKNPIIPISDKYKVWDPYLWLEGDTYYCLLGGNRLPNDKDTLYLMKSPDLVNWTPLHPFYEHPDLSWTTSYADADVFKSEDCSCPDFFKLGDKHVLLCISHMLGARCYVGRYENERFYPEQHVRMNWSGGTLFAPESLLDGKGRRIFWAWVMDPRTGSTKNATGSGAMSLPRVLSLAADDTLQITPVPELETLRHNHRDVAAIPLAADAEMTLSNVRGDSLELCLEIDPGQASEVGLKVRCSPDGEEETAIVYTPAAKTLKIDMSKSTLRTDVAYGLTVLDMAFRNTPRTGAHPKSTVEAPLDLQPGETLKLRVFLDKPLLEVFANDRQCVTQQVFPASSEALGIKVLARGGPATVRSGETWDMAPATIVNETAGLSAVSSVTREPCNKDLVPYVERSLRNFMVMNPQPIAGHPELRRVMFDCNGLPPSVGGDSQWGWGDGTGRAVEAWLGVRQMTGEREFDREVEQGQRDLLFWLLAPQTGMPKVPELSRPDQDTYYYHMWDQGRALRALVRWWLATDDPAEKQLLVPKITKLIASLQGLATMRDDPRWGPIAEFPYDVLNNGKGEESFAPMSGGQLIEPLAMYWPASGDTKARAFAEALCNGVLAAGDASSGKAPNYRFGQDGSFIGHFHNKASIALGVARQGKELLRRGERDRGLQLLRWTKTVYDWTLSPTNVNQGSTWGWFPETMGDGMQARTVMEICCTADMIELAAVLAGAAPLDPTLAEWDGLWDHVERYTLGAVVPSQFTITPAYAALAKARGGDLNVASRLVGAWAGYHPPNDWVTTLREDGQHEMLMGCCCNYSGLRALHACWMSVFVDDGSLLTVRLPITRRDALASQIVVEGPDQVRQHLQLAADRLLRVRIPDWATIERVAVGDSNGAKLTFAAEGRYLNLGKLAKGSDVVITYPLETRVTRERIGGDDYRAAFTPPSDKTTYTVRWRGNRVVAMDPVGKLLPIFCDP